MHFSFRMHETDKGWNQDLEHFVTFWRKSFLPGACLPFFTFCVVTYRHCRSVPLKLWYFKQEDVKCPKLHIISKSNLVDSQRCLCFLVILLWQSQSILGTKGRYWNCHFPGWTTSVGFKGVSHQVFLFFSLPPCLFVDDLSYVNYNGWRMKAPMMTRVTLTKTCHQGLLCLLSTSWLPPWPSSGLYHPFSDDVPNDTNDDNPEVSGHD